MHEGELFVWLSTHRGFAVKLWRDLQVNVREFLGMSSLRSQVESLLERSQIMTDALRTVLYRIDDLRAERTCTITILADAYVFREDRRPQPPSLSTDTSEYRLVCGASATLAEALGSGIRFLPRKPLHNLIWFLHAPAGIVVQSVTVGLDVVGLGSQLFGEIDGPVDPSCGIYFSLSELKP